MEVFTTHENKILTNQLAKWLKNVAMEIEFSHKISGTACAHRQNPYQMAENSSLEVIFILSIKKIRSTFV